MTVSDSDNAVRVRGLSKRYGEVLAVDGIDFDVAKGTITALLGGNGAGKTTTIAMILGLVEPSGGSIEVLGCQLPQDYHRVLPRMNFESPYVDLPHRLTVAQNLNVFAMLYGVMDRAGRIAELAADLVQETFVRAMNSPPARLDEPLRPWLVQVLQELWRSCSRVARPTRVLPAA